MLSFKVCNPKSECRSPLLFAWEVLGGRDERSLATVFLEHVEGTARCILSLARPSHSKVLNPKCTIVANWRHTKGTGFETANVKLATIVFTMEQTYWDFTRILPFLR